MTDQQLIDALLRLKVETGSLACAGCGHEHNCSLQGCNILREAVAAIREKEERRWIPVTERLPDIGIEVLVYSEDDGICVDYCDGDSFVCYYVTHWMPLPKPPKEGTP